MIRFLMNIFCAILIFSEIMSIPSEPLLNHIPEKISLIMKLSRCIKTKMQRLFACYIPNIVQSILE